jgi:hypothetical protein
MRTHLLVLLLATCLVMGAFASRGGEAPRAASLHDRGDVNMLALGRTCWGGVRRSSRTSPSPPSTGPATQTRGMILEAAGRAGGKKAGDVDVAMVRDLHELGAREGPAPPVRAAGDRRYVIAVRQRRRSASTSKAGIDVPQPDRPAYNRHGEEPPRPTPS